MTPNELNFLVEVNERDSVNERECGGSIKVSEPKPNNKRNSTKGSL